MYSSFKADFHISSKDKSEQNKILNASHTKTFHFPKGFVHAEENCITFCL